MPTLGIASQRSSLIGTRCKITRCTINTVTNHPAMGLGAKHSGCRDVVSLRCCATPNDVMEVANVFNQAWGTNVDVTTLSATIAPQMFAFSIFPYAGFLYCLTRSGKTPPMALFGFYFLLAFVFVTIPAGIYAKKEYGTTLANVDWLHGGAESLLTVTNLLVVLGFRQAIAEQQQQQEQEEQQERASGTQPPSQQAAKDQAAATREL